jgi:hypothetical protein
MQLCLRICTRRNGVKLAFRALLSVLCITIAFGTCPIDFVTDSALIADEDLFYPSPAPQSSLPEESESPESNETSKEGTDASVVLARRSHRKARLGTSFRLAFARWQPVRSVLAGRQFERPRIEHSIRNGCGADLRC